MTKIAVPTRPKPRPPAYTGPAFKKFEYAVQDYETESIEKRPAYPPKSAGCSLLLPGERQATYYAWGHQGELLPTKHVVYEDRDKFKRRLRDLRASKVPVLYQNGKFDCDVEEADFGLPLRPWEQVHDTLYLIFLHDPYAPTFSLKPTAERLLGMKPEEQERVRDWLIANKYAKKNDAQWGRFIARAPASLVGPYANGDITRTKRLFDKLMPEITKRGMQRSYDRERRLMPILLRTEREGIRCNLGTPPTERELNKGNLKLKGTLEHDYVVYLKAQQDADNWIRKYLNAPGLNVDADLDLGNALASNDAVTEWTWTTGSKDGKRAPQRSVSKKNLLVEHFKDRKLALVYAYRQRLGTCLGTFFEPWLAMARAGGGRIYTSWNQVRQDKGSKQVGAGTSRLSSSPNFQNIPKDFEDKNDGFVFEPWMAAFLPPLPLMRKYLLPDEGCTWQRRDVNQQELRFTAHFEDGGLADRYREDPRFDIHAAMKEGIRQIAGMDLNRASVKVVNFSDLYGKGVTGLSEDLGVDRKTAEAIKAAKNALMPGVAALVDSVKHRGRTGVPVRTWGGSEIYCEEARYVAKFNRVMDFAYKLFNHLIQRSSAEFTKEVTIAYDSHPQRKARFMLTVHDEFDNSSPFGHERQDMKVCKEVIESIPGVGVPMLSDGEQGKNWGTLTKYKD